MRGPALGADDLRELLDRGALEEGGEGQVLVQLLGDAREHPRGQQRMAAELEEIVAHTDVRQAQRLLPYLDQLHLEGIGGRSILAIPE